MIERNNILICGGFFLVAVVAFDVFQSIVQPRVTSRWFRLAPFLIGKVLWPSYRTGVKVMPRSWRLPVLESFAPTGYILLLLVWLMLLITGFATMLWGMKDCVRPAIGSFSEAMYFASTSFVTLGFGDLIAYEAGARLIVISAAVMGLIFMAMEISLLFMMQSYLQMREQVVNTLASRAGSPASGLVLLMRYRELNIVPSLAASFIQWENWVATVLESHRAFPLLIYFRSSSRSDSWLSSMGAILDAATLLSTAVTSETVGEAELFYWLGTSTLKSVCKYLEVSPDDGNHISREEFSDSLGLLVDSGYAVKTVDECFDKFYARRSGYMRYLIPLSDVFVLPVPSLINALPIKFATTAKPTEVPPPT